jgi:hypothetical protein
MRPYINLSRTVRIVIIALVSSGTLASASPGPPYRVDETAGVLTVIGVGRPPAEVRHKAQGRLLAERAAITNAYGAAASLLSEAMPQAVSGQEGHSVFLRGGRIARSELMPNGSVQVELEIPISPEIAPIVKEVMRGRRAVESQEAERAGIRHQEFVARHSIRGPKAIPLQEWIDRYRIGTWTPRNQ